MKKFTLFISLIICYQLIQAYPITPRPLRKLVIESDCIIQAYVIELGSEKVITKKKRKTSDYESTNHYALLLVREVWQGKVLSDTLKIYYEANMICPAPPRFEEHTEIIAFLDQNEEGFSVHALSYGIKTFFQKDGMAVYKKRIQEMQNILKTVNTQEKQTEIIEWLVTCAESEHTRWEGVYELSPQSDFMSYYDRDDEAAKGIYITAEQRKRLFAALTASTAMGYHDIGLVDLCKGVDDDKLLELLKTCLVKMDAEDLWTAAYYMYRIAEYTGNRELKVIYTEFDNFSPVNKDDEAKRKKLLADFIEKMKDTKPVKPLSASGNTSV